MPKSDKPDPKAEKAAAKAPKADKVDKPAKAKKAKVPTVAPVDVHDLQRVIEGRHHDPHGILGPHVHEGAVTIRTLRPWATSVVALVATPDGEKRYELAHEHGGIFTGLLDVAEVPDYRLEVAYGGEPAVLDDPYRFLPTLGDMDLHLLGEGRHETLWTVLGAHEHVYPSSLGDVHGTSFAVWAPNAQGVRVVGDHNHWDGTGTPMRSLGSSGVWEVFVPGVGGGSRYKFAILGRDGVWRTKADPLAQHTEHPPATASVVFTSTYEWQDSDWLTARAARDPHNSAMSTYEVHLGSWRPGLTYTQLADELVAYVVELGFTHVELMPVMEHPYAPSWGYQVTSYFAPTSRFGSPDEFRFLVDKLHQAGIGVILDWVPAHFPKDEWALARFDGTPLYEHADPRRGEQPDWGTYVFDFGRREVRNFLVANATYWLEEFHVDGLRVDAVASMLYLDYSRKDGEWSPNIYGGRENLEAVSFLQEANATAYKRSPGVVTIAEESTAWPGVTRPTHLGGLGFGLKWNMGWMHDTLQYVHRQPVHRQWHHHEMTFALVYAWSEQYVLPISHDEVVHGKGSLIARCRATAGSSSPTCAPTSPTCGRTPASSCCSWARSSGSTPSGASRAASTGGCSTTPTTAACSSASPTSTASTRRRRPCGRRTTPRPASSGSTPTTARATRSRGCAGAPTARRSPAWSTCPAARTRSTASACRTAARGTRWSTPTPRCTAAPASATSAAWWPRRCRGTGDRSRPSSASPRSAPSGSAPPRSRLSNECGPRRDAGGRTRSAGGQTSKRSSSMTLTHAATKSFANFACASSWA